MAKPITNTREPDSYILSGDYYGFIQQQAGIQRALDAEAKRAHYETLDCWQPAFSQPKTHEERLATIAAIYAEFVKHKAEIDEKHD